MNKQNILIGAVAGLLIFGGIGWKVYENKHPEVKTEIAAAEAKQSTDNGTSVSTNNSSSDEGVRIQKPGVPVNGTIYGVVEVGATGFNAFAVNIDPQDNWEIVKKSFGKSLAKEGMASAEDIRSGLKERISDLSEAGAAGRNIQFIVSSGAMHDPKIRTIMDEMKKSYTVNPVTADQEAKLALKAAMHPAYKDNSFVVDMGSGNTKITWYEGGVPKVTSELPGAKYYADGKTDAEVYEKIRNAAASVPRDKRANCFIIGGIPFELSKTGKSTGIDRFIELKSPDQYSAGDNVKLRSGLNIYRAIQEGTGCQHFIEDVDANFTIGYLLNRN